MKTLLIVLLGSTTAFAMGRAPSDPATWQDVQSVQTQVTQQGSVIAAQQSQLQDHADRLSELEGTKLMIEPVIRVYDGKRIALELFNDFDVNHNSEFAGGARITLKLGRSYEAKLIEKQQRQIDYLTELVSKLNKS